MFSIIKKSPILPILKNSLQKTSVSWFGRYVQHRDTPDNNDSVPFDFTSENYKEIDEILTRYPKNYKKSAVIPLLHLA